MVLSFVVWRMRLHGGLDVAELDAVELDPTEAAVCRGALRQSGLSGQVVNDTFFAWASSQLPCFDAVVGNPPYIRYQFVDPQDRRFAEKLVSRLGLTLRGVSNLWIPFAIVSLSLLRPGGAFALVLPSELFLHGLWWTVPRLRHSRLCLAARGLVPARDLPRHLAGRGGSQRQTGHAQCHQPVSPVLRARGLRPKAVAQYSPRSSSSMLTQLPV